jgi:transcriptional regulator with XRE-family HTH domain
MTTKKPHLVDIHVGNRLRELRCLAGLSQTALGRSVGVTFQQIQKYEKGANRVSASRLWDFASLLGAPVESFFPATSPPAGLACLDDPAFARWVQLYHDTPEESRSLLLKLVKVLANERLSVAVRQHV